MLLQCGSRGRVDLMIAPKYNEEMLVQLFGRPYHRGSTTHCHLDELFSFARKYFNFLNNAARNNNLSSSMSDYSNYSLLRECIIDFFMHIKEMLSLNDDNSASILTIKESLNSFRRLIKRIDCLPDFVIQNCTSESGNQCPLASFHVFHMYLELLWLHFFILLQINNQSQQEILFETECETFEHGSDMNSGFNPEIEKEIEWSIYNLISLANKTYNKTGSSNIFACGCVKEIWLAFQINIEKLCNENKCSNFWFYFNNIMTKYTLESKTNAENVTKLSNNLHCMETIKSNKPMEFPLHLLLKIAQLQKYDNYEDLDGIGSTRIVSNFSFLENVVKNITSNENMIPEATMRNIMFKITKLLNIWTETKNEIIMLLWEYFHKRLNCGFLIPGVEDTFVSLQNSSVADFVSDLKSRITLPASQKSDRKSDSSFLLFTTLLGLHLKKGLMQNQTALCQKIKGRIFPKFTPNKILALNEYGIKNFSTLFLVMAVATDPIEMCNKLQELILQLPFDNLPLNKKQIIIKTHLVILHLHVGNQTSIAKVAQPLKSIMLKYCNLRDTESISLVKMTLNGCLDIIDISNEFQNDEYVLIDSWIGRYLSVCNLSDVYKPLESFSSILAKVQIFCSYNMNHNESMASMINALFVHILACIKALYLNGTSALQVADLAYAFGKFVLDNTVYANKYESFENIVKYFINVDNANERVIRHFLIQILQDDQILHYMENDNKPCQSLLIRCWIKCALLSTETPCDDDTHLMLLICQLGEFSSLNITPCHGDAEQRSLCNFFYGIRKAWDNIQKQEDKFDFKKKVNQYIAGLDKCILKIIKAPPSLDFVVQLFITTGTLFLHCSPIIYSRGDPTCILHSFINTIILPPQLFMEKKLHPYVATAICRSWYMFMRGLYQLEYKTDMYVEKAMRDMVIQYLPFFAEKTLATKENVYNIPHRIIPNECSNDLILETYILEKISSNFITCRGKQSHIHSTKALSIIQQLCITSNINLLYAIVSCSMLSIFEQLMYSDSTNPNKRVAGQIVNTICGSALSTPDTDIRSAAKDVLIKVCQKHLAFSSSPFFKLVVNVSPMLGPQHMTDFVSTLKTEIAKVEKMRGVGYDQGLRNGIKDIEATI